MALYMQGMISASATVARLLKQPQEAELSQLAPLKSLLCVLHVHKSQLIESCVLQAGHGHNQGSCSLAAEAASV